MPLHQAGHPRLVMGVIVGLYVVTAVVTALYPPAYLVYPYLWASLAFVAATTTALAALLPHKRDLVLWAGTIAVCTACIRAGAIVYELTFDWDDGNNTTAVQLSFLIAATTWLTLGVLLHALWLHVIIPWSATKRQLAE